MKSLCCVFDAHVDCGLAECSCECHGKEMTSLVSATVRPIPLTEKLPTNRKYIGLTYKPYAHSIHEMT